LALIFSSDSLKTTCVVTGVNGAFWHILKRAADPPSLEALAAMKTLASINNFNFLR